VSRLPHLSGSEVVRALQKAGFEIVRQRGSHIYLRHTDGRATVVPVHKSEDLGPGILSKILRDAEMNREEFRQLL
jgi:predicted RNA binding protein YcfA (HicA-like mRNA interferase family)